jgi:putative Ca2+/H+ antiporter (TMEM165/GDT1 family)
MFLLHYTAPDPPSEFHISERVFEDEVIEVTFSWNSPQGNGSRSRVDNYLIVFEQGTTTRDIELGDQTYTWMISLAYNTNYSVGVYGTNCLGNGMASMLNIRIGKCHY